MCMLACLPMCNCCGSGRDNICALQPCAQLLQHDYTRAFSSVHLVLQCSGQLLARKMAFLSCGGVLQPTLASETEFVVSESTPVPDGLLTTVQVQYSVLGAALVK